MYVHIYVYLCVCNVFLAFADDEIRIPLLNPSPFIGVGEKLSRLGRGSRSLCVYAPEGLDCYTADPELNV